jgi:hypothetical protein
MPRILTDQPSSGKPLALVVPASHDCGFLSAAWTLLAEAPDFSVPGTGDAGVTLDPANPDRELRPGEVFIESPLTVSNTTGTARWAEVMIALQGIGSAYDGAVVLDDADKSIFCVPAKANVGRIYNPVTGVVFTPDGTYPGDESAFATGVKLNDGRVFTLSVSSTTARIYDPIANSVSTPGGTYPVGFTRDSVLLDDGRVFLVPLFSTTALIYDPVANTVTTPGGTYPGNEGHLGGVKLADGKVLLIPFASTTARIFDPVANTVTTPGGTFPGDKAFRTGILMSDGRVLCVPINTSQVLIFNPAGGGSVTAATGASVSNFVGAVNLPDNRVFLVPFKRTTGAIYDPATNTVTLTPPIFPGEDQFKEAVLIEAGPNTGKVFMVPHNATVASIYDPITNTLEGVPGDFPACSEEVIVAPRVNVPSNGSVQIPIQGLRLLKTTFTHEIGGRLLVRAEVSGALKVYGSAVELEAATHAPNTD